jgi:hypothetical protein
MRNSRAQTVGGGQGSRTALQPGVAAAVVGLGAAVGLGHVPGLVAAGAGVAAGHAAGAEQGAGARGGVGAGAQLGGWGWAAGSASESSMHVERACIPACKSFGMDLQSLPKSPCPCLANPMWACNLCMTVDLKVVMLLHGLQAPPSLQIT